MRKTKTIATLVTGVLVLALWAAPMANAYDSAEHTTIGSTTGGVSIGSCGVGCSPSAPSAPSWWHVY